MDNPPHFYFSELEDCEDIQEEPDMSCEHIHLPKQDAERDSFLCQHCKRCFTSRQGLEQHMHRHAFMNNVAHEYKSNSSGSDTIYLPHEKMKPVDAVDSIMQVHTLTFSSTNTSLLGGDHSGLHCMPETLEDHHACMSTEKIFTTNTNKQQHECNVHEDPLELAHDEQTKLPQEDISQTFPSESSQLHLQHAEKMASTLFLKNEGEYVEQYMLDVPNNISENLSFYIDGKMVSTSTVGNCEVAEGQSGTLPLVGLDALILDPVQINQVLNTDIEMPYQQQAKRRTTTPPLLPQIKTELESEEVASSFSSSLVSSLIENLFPQNSEPTVVQKERTIFLSPKLKQFLEKQEGLKSTLALITDGQTSSSPISPSVLPSGTGRFKRRTSSPTGLTQQISTINEETPEPDSGDFGSGSSRQIEAQRSSPVQQVLDEDNSTTPSVAGPEVKPFLSESWPPVTGGNSCNQKPLDLSNTFKRNDDVTSGDSVLDLSLQRKSPGNSEPTINFVSQAVLKEVSNACVVENVLGKTEEQKINLGNLVSPLVTDFTLVTGSDVGPLEHVADGLVYGLAIPPSSLSSSDASLTPVALETASPCTFTFASPAAHTVLPTAPSVITVLAPPSSISNPSSQPFQVLTPNLSHEPLVICTEKAFNSADCDLTTSFGPTNPANIITLSQPLDPTMNLPGHVFLTDQIALNTPVVESSPQVPFTSAVTLNDSLLNIASNTVLIECTISLEAPGGIVPPAVTLQESAVEHPSPIQMVANHTEQQQIVSVPNPQTVDHTILVSSVAKSIGLSNNTDAISDSPTVDDSKSDPELVSSTDLPTKNEEETADSLGSMSEIPPKDFCPPPLETANEESSNNTENDPQQQTFTKNFICNVCDKLFHSMKKLGHHVVDHADEWPYKCEFCVLLFGKPSDLLDHRSSLHGVGKTYVCSACTKEFVYLCNLKQHQEELHPRQLCSYTEEEKGKLRPQNYNNSTKVNTVPLALKPLEEPKKQVKKEECDVDVTADELLTTIKIMTSDGSKVKGPDVRLGINQHYPSFKPPPFPYHNRSPAGSLASATNFTTHNIPQTFSTAIRCTKCGNSFDNMPELHKHILACANASDKRRYTPRKNPIPLRHFAKSQNGVLSTTNTANGLNKVSQASMSNPSQESPIKLKILNKRKKKFAQRVMPQRNKSVPSPHKMSPEPQEIFVCPHCSREFTMRRSRTKHAAVCPKKPKEIKRKEGGISVTKENDEHLQRGLSHVKEKQQSSPQHNTRLQTSISAKRPAVLPVQTVFSSKRSKIIIKEDMQPKEEVSTLSEVSIRTFNPSMRQYTRVQHSIKGVPIKITIVKPRQNVPQKDESPSTQSREEATGTISSRSERNVLA
ncbi:PR domain zinc finger protein 2 [Nematolebias whitei]|uniref:PR domain zinc finger protein 2 n=1 Tax=Nematolebias whitei TaxID=451745 RepID=UPI001899B5A3|nr:PR domain zinc finger protein 2 [Nematolebias whitei]XP_037540199.1 PR domain zinc finger protein 2 [Nematolebias whitei]